MRSEPNDGLNSRCSGAVATALEPITEFNALDRRPGALAGDDFSFNSVRGGPGWSARPLIGDGPANAGSQMRPLPLPDAPVFQKLKNFAARKNRTRSSDICEPLGKPGHVQFQLIFAIAHPTKIKRISHRRNFEPRP